VPCRLLVDGSFANMKRQKTAKKKQTDSQRVLGKTRLSSDVVTPKDFKPWHFKDCKTEDDVLSVSAVTKTSPIFPFNKLFSEIF